MKTVFTTIENQIRADGSKGLLYDHYEDDVPSEAYNAALAKFYTICAAASTSGIPYHAAFILSDNGQIVKGEIFDRRIAPTPETEE